VRLLVTRPQPAAGASAARLTAMGHDVQVSPLLAPVAVDWTPPDEPPRALLLTSASAVRLGNLPVAWRTIPVFAVGSATAAAATAAGWSDVRDARGDVAAALALAVRSSMTRLLHLAGADRTEVAVPPELTVDVATVYAARPAALSAEAAAALGAGAIDAVLLYSPRTAALFTAQADAAAIDRARVALAALSPAVAAAAGGGWRDIAVAADPHEDALFAALARLCDKAADLQG
jgi:uroporphyrinogen-III synthase